MSLPVFFTIALVYGIVGRLVAMVLLMPVAQVIYALVPLLFTLVAFWRTGGNLIMFGASAAFYGLIAAMIILAPGPGMPVWIARWISFVPLVAMIIAVFVGFTIHDRRQNRQRRRFR